MHKMRHAFQYAGQVPMWRLLSINSSKEIVDYHQSKVNYVMVQSLWFSKWDKILFTFITACYNATSVCRSRLVTPSHILFRLGVWKAENIWKLLRAYIMKWKITQWWSTLSTISTKWAITSDLKSLKTSNHLWPQIIESKNDIGRW